MIERTSLKLFPIVKEVLKRMIEEKTALVVSGSNQAASVAVYEA